MEQQVSYYRINRAGTILVKSVDKFAAPFVQFIDNCIPLSDPTDADLREAKPLTVPAIKELASPRYKSQVEFELSGRNHLEGKIRRLHEVKDDNRAWTAACDSICDAISKYDIDKTTLNQLFTKIAQAAPESLRTVAAIKEYYERRLEEKDAIQDSKAADKEQWKTKTNIEEHVEQSGFVFGRMSQALAFIKLQPLFYDRNKMWWAYDRDSCSWKPIDETDILNGIRRSLQVDTIDSKARHEIIAALQQAAREKEPKRLPKEYIQFGKTIVNPKTGEQKPASPEYFVTTPIPHELSTTEDTPNVDRLFKEWVGESYAKTLYQIFAYSLTPHKFMQRLFAFTGGGSNGKGTCEKLLIKLVGQDNIGTSDLKSISTDRHATSYIYNKLVVFLGESSYDDLKNTNLLKKMSGEDKLIYNFKGKTGFSDDVTFTLIQGTNALPETPDQSSGFYRRWLIIDFPTQFTGITTDVLECVDEAELRNLCTKCVRILSELYTTKKFANEGTFDERRERYESRSRPLDKFLAECCEETSGEYTPQREFANEFNIWLKTNNLRQLTVAQVGGMLRQHGFQVGSRKVNNVSVQCIINIKMTSKTSKTSDSESQKSCEKANLKNASSTGNTSQRRLSNSSNPLVNVLTSYEQSTVEIATKLGTDVEATQIGLNYLAEKGDAIQTKTGYWIAREAAYD